MILPANRRRPAENRLQDGDDTAFVTFFRRDCEACLAPLHVRVEYLGQRVLCPHCGHGFTAADPSQQASAGKIDLERRVTQFLRGRGASATQHVHVELDGHTVVLRGRVSSARDRWLCASSCARVAGVRRVIDELEIENSGAANSSE